MSDELHELRINTGDRAYLARQRDELIVAAKRAGEPATAIADAAQLTRQQVHRILAAAVEDETIGRGPKIYEFTQQNAGHYLLITGPSDRVSGRFRVADSDAREGDFILEQSALVVIDELSEGTKGDLAFAGHVDWERTRSHWNETHDVE